MRGLERQRHRLEAATSPRLDQLVEILAAGLHQAARGVLGRPALELDARLALGGQLELLAAPGRLHHLPRITRRRRGVHDDRRRRRHGARRSRTCRSSGRSTGASCRRTTSDPSPGSLLSMTSTLPFTSDALEVVPLVLGRFDAVADEHQRRRSRSRRVARLHAGAGDVVVGQLEIDACRPCP